MPNSLVLATVSQALVFPCVSRKSGRLCRAVPTRQLILDESAPHITLVACIDRRGNIHRTAVRDVMSMRAGLLAHAERLWGNSPIVTRLSKLPEPTFSLDGTGTPYAYLSLNPREAAELAGGWPMRSGFVTAQLVAAAGVLAHVDSPLALPLPLVGVLWSHGDFARPAASHITALPPRSGFLLQAKLPLDLAARVITRNRMAWGEKWEPAPLSEAQARPYRALNMARVGDTRVPLTRELMREAMSHKHIADLGTWWHECECRSLRHGKRWRSDEHRSSTKVMPEDWSFAHLFERG
jgi:hypothetical protein